MAPEITRGGVEQQATGDKNIIVDNKNKMDRENIQNFTVRTANTVSERFEKQNIPFDRETSLVRLRKALEPVLLDPNIPETVKEKFKQHVKNKIETFSNATAHEISVLKNHRIAGSLGTEWIELNDKNDKEKSAFFLGKILEETIAKDIEPVAYSLTQSFSPVRVSHPTLKEVSYNDSNLKELTSGIKDLDNTFDLHVLDRAIAPLGQKYDISKSNINFQVASALLQGLTDRGYRVKDMVYFKDIISRTSPLAEGVRFSDRREGETTIIDKNGKPVLGKDGKNIDGVELLLDYLSKVEHFQGTEREIRETRESALDKNIISDTIRGFAGMDQFKTDFDHLKIDDVEAKMKKASFAEMIMIGTQLAQLYPVGGDIAGGIDQLVSTYNGRTMDGAKLNGLERGLSSIFGVLGITVLGGFAARAYNAGKMEKLIRSFGVIKEVFPGKLAEFLKTGGKLSEEAKNGLMKFAKIMGEEFAQQIEGMMKKNGMILGFTEDAKKFESTTTLQLAANKKTPVNFENSIIISLGNDDKIQVIKKVHKDKGISYEILTPDGASLPIKEGQLMTLGVGKNSIDLGFSKEVSRNHLTIMVERGELSILDHGSTNGTFLEISKTIPKEIPRVLNKEKTRISELGEILTKKWNQLPKETRELITELYPDKNGIFAKSSQGGVGNCYFLAAINAEKYSEHIFDMLGKTIKKVPEGWEVTFLGLTPGKNKTIISNFDLRNLVDCDAYGRVIHLSAEAPLGDKILERAYWRLRNYRAQLNKGNHDYGNKVLEIPPYGSDMTKMNFTKDNKGELTRTHEGGTTDVVMKDIFGFDSQGYDIDGIKNVNNFREELITANNEKGVMTVSTIQDSKGDSAKFVLQAIEGEFKLSKSHGYSAYYDKSKDTVTLINPHDTDTQNYSLKLEDFLKNKNFSRIVISIPPMGMKKIPPNIEKKINPAPILPKIDGIKKIDPLTVAAGASGVGALGFAGWAAATYPGQEPYEPKK